MFYYYKYNDKYLFSNIRKYDYIEISENEALNNCDFLYYLTELDPTFSKRSFSISDSSLLFLKEESIHQLKTNKLTQEIPSFIANLIDNRRVKCINTLYPNFEEEIYLNKKKRYRVNVLALGDVGSTLLIGLKLLGGTCIDTIGISDRSNDKLKRWEYEMNQTSLPFNYDYFPEVESITKEELFNCDMFIFCASKGVPPVGTNVKDVRMIQFKENAKIIKEYAIIARAKNFKGIFAVVSDPVDQLCKTVLIESNKDKNGNNDFNGLAPEQIKGYGLGVMNARAAYYAKKMTRFKQFLKEGRAFGPHGKDLVIADSIKGYNNELSLELTNLTVNANLDVRETGFKPFIAPALSSGAISIVLTLNGEWHYSSNYLNGVYMGSKNKNTLSGLELEKLDMSNELFDRIEKTYRKLSSFNYNGDA